ncbi:MAG: hypothetical protein WBG19_02375 [Thermoplasmata archaeon]
MTSGFATAAFVLGTFNSNPFQSSASGTPNAPPGVSYVLARAYEVNATGVPAAGACVTSNLGTLVAPTALVDGAATGICLNTPALGFGTGDIMYVFEVQWSNLAAVSTTFQVQIGVDVTPAANDVVVASYVQTSATITTSEQAIFALDMTAASDTSVVQFNILMTQL